VSGRGKSSVSVPAELETSYLAVRSPAADWLVRRGFETEIEHGVLDFLLQGPAQGPHPPGRGRGPMARLHLGGAFAIGKRARHGGLLAPILGRLYLGNRRGMDQISAARRLTAAGVATPEVLAVGTAHVLGPLCSQAIVTRELRGARNLLDVARADPPVGVRCGILEQCADLIRNMHASGFLHADLNVSNLVLGHGAAGEVMHIVDLDRGRFLKTPTPRMLCRNLARLVRSYEKWIADTLPLTRREEIVFLRRYAGRDRGKVRALAQCLARSRSRLRLRRWLWRLSDGSRH
jgi:tRNA A-37 threonylcarbamoyl transferase component Bud32